MSVPGDVKYASLGKIKCPRHFLLKPGAIPFQVEPNPLMKDVPEWAYRKWPKLRKYQVKRDRYGNPVRNNASFYQPEISRSFAIEHIYDPKNPICTMQCKGRCKEGMGIILETSIKRLNG